MTTELQKLLAVYEGYEGYEHDSGLALLRAIVARLDAEPYPFLAALRTERYEARVRIDELEATLDAANRKIVATLQERDNARHAGSLAREALERAERERDEAREDSAKRGEAMTRLGAALSRADAAEKGEG